ncbi:MAG: aminotransferase class I/II-fold pyridoxal phosphate-dependent enzyme, partial [Verrucomicrobia bacterium]|nr:aminotransferase class I/II-fold pyridoxal phosphate-dependent enzyme [Cytophagales bacterium]
MVPKTSNLEKRLTATLEERREKGNFRWLKPENQGVDFCSNDYLGLASNIQLADLIAQNYHKNTPKNGSGGSRLLAGNTQYALDLEVFLADIFQAEQTLVFQSGYAANAAVLSCVPQKGDTIITDELIHASLREGAKLSFAHRFSFRHNDLEDLEKKLQSAGGEKFVVAESVYSMDGDFGKLEE